jgi:hypothetical protein
MASLMDKIANTTDASIKERLALLLATARGKLDKFELELNEMFRNPASMEGVQIVGDRAFEQYKIYSINITQSPASDIKQVLEKFFQGTENGVKDGILGLVEIGLNTVLGNRIVGESEQSMFFIVPDRLNLLRVDVKCWRYNFSSKDIINDAENAFCYIFTKSIIDHTKLTADELVYFISRISGGDFTKALEMIDGLKVLVEKLAELYKVLADMNPKTLAENYLATRPSWAQRVVAAANYVPEKSSSTSLVAPPNKTEQ